MVLITKELNMDKRNDSRRTDVTGLESDIATMHPLISWRSVVAGTLVAFFSMIGLLGLGMAFGGIGLDADTSLSSAGIFTGVWFLVSSLVSIFLGSYFAARVSKFQTGRIGSAQGLVIAALFLGFFLYQTIAAVGTIGSAAGSLVGNSASLIGQGAQQAAQSPAITSTVSNLTEDALGDLNLRSDPQTVIMGVTSRLMNGNVEGAQTYLSRQTGITQAEASARISQLNTQVQQAIDQAKQGAATALKSAGWSLFLLVALGALAAIGGGALGSVTNFRKPLSREQLVLKNQHA
jgi:hypothetical protein